MSYKEMSNVFITRLRYYRRTFFAVDISFYIVTLCCQCHTFHRNTQKEEIPIWKEY